MRRLLTRLSSRWLATLARPAACAAVAGLAACADPILPTAPAARIDAETGAVAAAVTAQATSTVAMGPYTVTITDLGVPTGGTYSSGYGINNLGQVAGMSSNSAGAIAPILWSNGTWTAIPNYDPSGLLIPVKINDAGDMLLNESIGGTSINYAIWRDVGGTFHRLPPFPGGDALRVNVRSINSFGVMTGMVREPNLAPTMHGVLWRNDLFLMDMGPMNGYSSISPQDINDAGQVVGTAYNTTTFANTAFVYADATYQNLGALSAGAASTAMAINATGTIVGTSNGGFPVRWVNAAIQSLPVPNGVIQPTPVDVNDGGDIIGWGTSTTVGALYASAFWRNGTAYLLPPWPGGTQTMVRAINNNAEIVGEGNLVAGGPMHALVWKVTAGSPPPPPANTAPTVSLVATTSTTIRKGGSVTFRGSFTDPDNGPWKYTFTWGNGSTSGSQSANGSVTQSRKYGSRGTYSVRYAVTDAAGATATSGAITVTVR